MQSVYKVADVLNLESEHLHKLCLNSWQERTLHALRKCRTQALGGHIDACNCCKNYISVIIVVVIGIVQLAKDISKSSGFKNG